MSEMTENIMTDHAELIAELLAEVRSDGDVIAGPSDLDRMAADAIASLTEQVERLIHERDEQRVMFLYEADKHSEWLEKFMGMKRRAEAAERKLDDALATIALLQSQYRKQQDHDTAVIERLTREWDEARAKVERQATEIQRMARKIKNQRKMASTTWQIVEDRAQWTRGVLKRDRYLAYVVEARAERLAAEAREKRLREALKPFAVEANGWADMWHDDYVPVLTPSTADEGDNERAAFTVGDLRRARAALGEQG